MKLLVSAAALVLGLAAAGASAAPASGTDGKPGQRQIGMIKAMDADGDGKVSKAEFLAFQPKNRPAVAADAKVTREEFMQRTSNRWHIGGPRAEMTPERKAKMEERRADAFKTLDKDGNGSISRDEFMGFQGGLMIRTAPQRQEMKDKMEGRRAEAFKRMDANNDGVIDGAERAASREAAFARMDRNGDGFITADELPRRGHHGPR